MGVLRLKSEWLRPESAPGEDCGKDGQDDVDHDHLALTAATGMHGHRTEHENHEAHGGPGSQDLDHPEKGWENQSQGAGDLESAGRASFGTLLQEPGSLGGDKAVIFTFAN